jgi:hypothetical protein
MGKVPGRLSSSRGGHDESLLTPALSYGFHVGVIGSAADPAVSLPSQHNMHNSGLSGTGKVATTPPAWKAPQRFLIFISGLAHVEFISSLYTKMEPEAII